MSNPIERAEQAVTRARNDLLRELRNPTEWVSGEVGADDRESRRLVDTLIEAAREVERQVYLHQPILRTCAVPACFKQYDSLNGGKVRPEWSPEGWRALRLSAASHFCPTHVPLLDDHMPQWAERQDDRSRLTCQCGWTSPGAFWHGYAVAAWQDHLAQTAALVHPDTQEQP